MDKTMKPEALRVVFTCPISHDDTHERHHEIPALRTSLGLKAENYLGKVSLLKNCL